MKLRKVAVFVCQTSGLKAAVPQMAMKKSRITHSEFSVISANRFLAYWSFCFAFSNAHFKTFSPFSSDCVYLLIGDLPNKKISMTLIALCLALLLVSLSLCVHFYLPSYLWKRRSLRLEEHCGSGALLPHFHRLYLNAQSASHPVWNFFSTTFQFLCRFRSVWWLQIESELGGGKQTSAADRECDFD